MANKRWPELQQRQCGKVHAVERQASVRAHQLGLFDQGGGVAADIVHDPQGSGAPEGGLALAGHQQRVHQGLGMVAPDADEQAVDEPAHHRLAVVDPGYHLQQPPYLIPW